MTAAKKGAGAAGKRWGKSGIKYPSKASLREMPELPPDAELRPHRYAKKIQKAGGGWFQVEGKPRKWLPSPRGRPRKGDKAETTRTHSVRVPDSVWNKLEKLAEARGKGANTLAAEVLAEFAQRGAA